MISNKITDMVAAKRTGIKTKKTLDLGKTNMYAD